MRFECTIAGSANSCGWPTRPATWWGSCPTPRPPTERGNFLCRNWLIQSLLITARRFIATVGTSGHDRVFVPVPFDPDQVWGVKPRHHITGTVNGLRVRGVVEVLDTYRGIALGAARGAATTACRPVTTSRSPCPQKAHSATTSPKTSATVLDANPAAAAFFDSLAQFYQRAYPAQPGRSRRSTHWSDAAPGVHIFGLASTMSMSTVVGIRSPRSARHASAARASLGGAPAAL